MNMLICMSSRIASLCKYLLDGDGMSLDENALLLD